jgi:hypothetical protein
MQSIEWTLILIEVGFLTRGEHYFLFLIASSQNLKKHFLPFLQGKMLALQSKKLVSSFSFRTKSVQQS